jgi:tetratricopeptide (TPR) repeat protein
MSPVDATIRILKNNGKGLLDNVWVDHSKRATGYPVCSEYNVLCLHDFPWGNNGLPIVNTATVSKARKILNYKISTLKQYCSEDGRILFLRNILPHTLLYEDYCDHNVQISKLNELVRTVEDSLEITDFQIMAFYKRDCFPQLTEATDLDPRLLLIEEDEGVTYQAVIDCYLATHPTKTNKDDDHSISNSLAGDGKYSLVDYYRTPPENVENLSDLFVVGHIQEWNMQKVIAIFYQRWLEHHGHTAPQAKLAYYHLGMAYLTGGETDKAAEAFRKGLELDLSR